MYRSLLSVLLITSLNACQSPQDQVNTHTETDNQLLIKPNPLSTQLNTVIDQAWQLRLKGEPALAYTLGDQTAAGKIADLSPSTLLKHNQQRQTLLNQLAQLPTSDLSKMEQINRQILTDQLQDAVDRYHFNMHYLPLTAEGGFHTDIASISKKRFQNEQDYQHYLGQLAVFPHYFKQQTAWLKQGIKSGITLPKITLIGFENSISAFIVPVQESGYYTPFKTFPAHFSEQQKAKLLTQGEALIRQNVLPSYRAFYHFMTNEYLPNARTNIAATHRPNGQAFYENRVRYYTTRNMTADEVHKLGLQEVKRIRQAMKTIIDELKFAGSFAEFLHFLRNDPQFYATSPEQLLKEAAFIAKKADAILPRYFTQLPSTPYGIAAVPAEIAPKYTTGRYLNSNSDDEPGYYWVNTYALNKRPLYELEALTLHEAVPGHHLQISLNQSLTQLPNFRRYSYISAFGEGWGLYAEYLGLEAGFYQDPYSNFGRLTYEMWRAARLVVDTGMHAKGWSRQQAIDFMANNTALSLHNVTTEIDRYITWPGQSLSYKIGELTIKKLRLQAEQALGAQFDLRAFHDAILEHGSVPMTILEQQIQDFIHTQQKNIL
ncbi:DUF885 domain-containing protein [Shewanella surugensis]|uniref:DUF885 domain-containing protein n=1 Tax=Shewanella surugensis TaxID=212020 RepID=A0ABT0LB81_9GAMM|nr:DUF885 domain-containing protein [Shewanella surugensis]MCL1124431.1 DUF885 domain-containing protein [Shewanella surugensis]